LKSAFLLFKNVFLKSCFKLQISQINSALDLSQNPEEQENLLSLKNDLLELINLTKETLHQLNPGAESENIPNASIQDELDLFYKDLEGSENQSNDSFSVEKSASTKKIKIDNEMRDIVGTK
jgi:hypothetical protein